MILDWTGLCSGVAPFYGTSCMGIASLHVNFADADPHHLVSAVYIDNNLSDYIFDRPGDGFIDIFSDSTFIVSDNQQGFRTFPGGTWKFESETNFPGCDPFVDICKYGTVGIDSTFTVQSVQSTPESSTLVLLTLAMVMMFLWRRVSRRRP